MLLLAILDNRECRFLDGPPKDVRQWLDYASGRTGIQAYLAVAKVIWMQPAKQQVRVRHRGKSAGSPITGRARFSASTLRPHPKHSTLVDPCD